MKTPPSNPPPLETVLHRPFPWKQGFTCQKEVLCVTALLLFQLGICLHAAFSESVTHDEIWHLPVGMRNLREGRFDVERVNPPLTRLWAAIPAVLCGIEADPHTSGQPLGEKFVLDHPYNFMTWYQLGRCCHLVWTLATGVMVYLWGRRCFGVPAALLSLVFFVTSPNIAGYGSVITPDAGGMFGYLATLYALCCWCDRPTWSRGVLWGVSLGIAQGLKMTCLLLYPLCMVVILIQRWKCIRHSLASGKIIVLQIVMGMAVSLLALWASYGFQQIGQPLDQFHFQSRQMLTIQNLLSSVSRVPVPFPRDYLLGIDEQLRVMAGQHPVFLDGEWSLDGFRRYFLMTLLYKLPHLLQLCLGIALIFFLLTRNGRAYWRDTLTLLVPSLLTIQVASGESLQLGIRYILPVIPMLMILSGGIILLVDQLNPSIQKMFWGIIVAGSLLSLRYLPGHLAYFNEWAGGPMGGRHHLLDSNLDWGQDLGHLRDELQARKLDRIQLAYFGTVPPQVVGIVYELPPSWKPEPGWYAVSVNFVMGRPHGITQGDGSSRAVDFQEFGYFRFFRPVKTLGGSIDLYEIRPEDIARWNAARHEQMGD